MPNDHTTSRRDFLRQIGNTSLAGVVGGLSWGASAPGRAMAAPRKASSRKLQLGTNVSPAVRWSPWWPDENAALRISQWFNDAWQGQETDEQGYPLQSPAQTLIFHDIASPARGQQSYPPGEYVITWDGTASLSVDFDAQEVSRDGNRLVARVDRATEEGFLLRIESGIPRNLHIAMPPGTPRAAEILAGYRVIRFMDWLGVNLPRTASLTWDNRPRPGRLRHFEGASAEYAVEDCVQFANDAAADPWFCIHHLADDSYIRGFAQYVAEHSSASRIYVEWSNECWNVIFPQGEHYVFGGFDEWPRQIARDAARAFRIWREVLGDRVICVAGCQLGNPWVGQVLSEALDGDFDVLSPAAYFGLPDPEEDGIPLPRTAAGMLEVCLASIERGPVREAHEVHTALARQWGKPLAAYEGGQHLMQPAMLEDDRLAAQMVRAQSLPEMKAVYLANLRLIESLGYNLFCHYTYGARWDKFGCWGINAHQNVTSPKEEAIRDFFGLM